jgi:hypothetical protein
MGRTVSFLYVTSEARVQCPCELGGAQKVAVIQVFLRILRFSLVPFHQQPMYYRSHIRVISGLFDSVVTQYTSKSYFHLDINLF